MADLFGAALTTAVALTGGTAKTALQIVAPSNHRVKVTGWAVYFDGTNSVAVPIRVRVLRQTTAGTMTALTPTKTALRAETLLTTAQMTASVEPGAGDVVDSAFVHPQQGYEVKFAPGQEITLGGTDRLGIECYAPSSVNVIAKFLFEE